MKKITLTIAAIAFFISASKAQDKAFEKGNMTVGLGAGFGLYGTKTHTEQDRDVIVWTGSGFAIEKQKFTQDTTDAAASAIYPLTFEYGITNWFGLGARFAYSNYFEETDSITHIKSKVRGIDADLMANFHLVKSKHFDMPISLTFGYSNFKYWANDVNNTMGKDNGLNYGIALIPRIYFGNHIGMFFNVGYAGYSYPSIQFSDDNNSNLNSTSNWVFKIKGSGANLGIGLVGKF